jgi:hypothetical protein
MPPFTENDVNEATSPVVQNRIRDVVTNLEDNLAAFLTDHTFAEIRDRFPGPILRMRDFWPEADPEADPEAGDDEHE